MSHVKSLALKAKIDVFPRDEGPKRDIQSSHFLTSRGVKLHLLGVYLKRQFTSGAILP